MANSLFPAFFQVEYHSAYGAHVQTIPTTAWNAAGGLHGSFLNWASSQVDAEDMIDDFILLQSAFFPATVVFDSWTIYTMATPTSPAVPQNSKNITVAGTNATPGNTQAVQSTWTFRTTLGGIFKIVMLDVGNNNSFAKITSATVNAGQTAYINFLTGLNNGFAGRDGGRPSFFRQIAFTLNEKLRREYRMN